MNKFFLIVSFVMSLSTLACSTNDSFSKDRARYDHYRIYYVHLDSHVHVKIFQEIEENSDSYTFYGHARHSGQKLTIMVAAQKVAEFADILQTNKINYEVLTYNFQEQIDAQFKDVLPEDTPPEDYDWDHYFHLTTIYAWLEKLAKLYDYIDLVDMGNSHEGVPIKGVKLEKTTNSTDASKTTVFIESGIHAREWIAPAVATYILNKLITSTDEQVKELSEKFNWIIFPVVNPDGYKYTFEYDRMWRKNRNLYGLCRGVDLNRNFPFHWNETGSSPDPCAYDYAGPSAASEIETQRIIRYVKKNTEEHKIKTYFALHSFSQLIMFPYGYSADKVENYDDLTVIAKKAAEAIKTNSGRVYKAGSIFETIYPSSGGSKDWAHAIAEIPITFTFELRGPPDSRDLFILPANQIFETGEEIFAAFAAILDKAENLGYYNGF